MGRWVPVALICTPTHFGIPARRTCWRAGPICAQSKKCSVIRAFRRPSVTPTCPSTSCSRYTTGRTLWHKPRGNRPSVVMGPAASKSLDRILKASSGAALGSTLGLLLVATIDCAYAAHAEHFRARWLADAGLLAPLALGFAGLLAFLRLFFHAG